MRAFVLQIGSPVEPLGDPPGDTLVLNEPLRSVQRKALAAAGVTDVIGPVKDEAELPDPAGEPYLVIGDDLFFSASLARAFLADGLPAAREGKNIRLVMPECRSVKDNAPMQDLVRGTLFDGRAFYGYPMWLTGAQWGGGAGTRPRLETFAPLAVDPREEVKKIENVPRVFAPDRTISFPFTGRTAIRIQHWVHVLRANQLAMMAMVAAIRERPKIVNLLAILWLLVRSFPPSRRRIGRKLGRIGRGCDIHPTAVVEASIIGDRVKIGAHAVVRASILGNGVVIEDYGYAEMSVFGDGAALTKKAISNFNVLYPGAVLGHLGCQMSLLGHEAFVSTDSRIYDLKFDGNVQVEHRGRKVDSGSRFLGACVGHRASVGAGVFLLHGIAVPNDAVLVKSPWDVVREVPDLPGKPLMVKDGKAVPIGKGARRATVRGTTPVAAAATAAPASAGTAASDTVAAPARAMAGGDPGADVDTDDES